jgi:hypothetical protein
MFILFVVLVVLLDYGACSSFNRSSFPAGFVFGSSSSAYQVFHSLNLTFVQIVSIITIVNGGFFLCLIISCIFEIKR